MARIARDPVDVILGEAGGKTWAERFNDMLAIASVIDNRARSGRVSYQDVVGNRREFNAFGKALPSGVERYRGLAQLALEQVQKTGPTHRGTFYATPSKTGNLPSGLQQTTKTAGHVYFSDPMGRSFLTAAGYVSPAPATTALTDPVTPATAPTPTSAPRGMAALTPNGLAPHQIDLSPLSAPGKGRSEVPTSGIVGMVAQSADRVVPGAVTSLYSGMEPQGRSPVGAADRHPRGFAGDFDFFSPTGQQITDPVAMQDIAMDMAARHQANIGYSQTGYMGPGRMHVDVMPLGQFPGGAQWGSTAKSWAENLDFARQTGIGPTPYTNAPTPVSREIGLSMPAPANNQRAAEIASMAALQAQTAPQTPASAYAQMAQSMTGQGIRGLSGAPMATPATPVGAPPVTPASLPQQAAPVAPTQTAPVAPPMQTQLPSVVPAVPVQTQKVAPVQPPVVPPVQAPIAQPVAPTQAQAVPSAPQGFMGSQNVYDAFNGMVPSAVTSGGTTVSRGRDGTTYSYNPEFDLTTITTPTGHQGTQRGNAIDNARSSSAANTNRGGILGRAGGILGDAFGPGGKGRGMLGGMAGSVLGGTLAGPAGAMALGMIGREMASRGGGYQFGQGLGRAGLLGRNELSGLLGMNFAPGLAFPSAPDFTNQPTGATPSYAEMAAISPAVAAAISEGRSGVY